MPKEALLLILLSAAMHAGWILILKTSRRKLAFNFFVTPGIEEGEMED